MSTRDAHRLYSLLQAFDLTGQRLFQNDWTGHEVFAAPLEDPEAITRRRDEIEQELIKLKRADRRLQAEIEEDALSEAERRDITEESKKIWAERDALNAERNALPKTSDAWHRDHAGYARRMAVEKTLRDAFEAGELTLHLPTGYHAKYDQWITERHFYMSFGLSVVIPPRSEGIRRHRYPAYIDRDQFEVWLNTAHPKERDADPRGHEEQFRVWLLALVSDGEKPGKKDVIWFDAHDAFPKLSRRAFDRVWKDTVPAHWSKTGPS